MNFDNPVGSEKIQSLAMPLFESKGWIRLLGVLAIVYGVLVALSIVGIIIAWLPIWMGVLLYKASTSIESAFRDGDEAALMECFGKLKTFFTIQGVLALIGLVVAGIVIVFSLMGLSELVELLG
ncbi:MAG: DUF5362 domain-containing protein [Gemmatimonadales bacterium]|jgi:hypothetical protein